MRCDSHAHCEYSYESDTVADSRGHAVEHGLTDHCDMRSRQGLQDSIMLHTLKKACRCMDLPAQQAFSPFETIVSSGFASDSMNKGYHDISWNMRSRRTSNPFCECPLCEDAECIRKRKKNGCFLLDEKNLIDYEWIFLPSAMRGKAGKP